MLKRKLWTLTLVFCSIAGSVFPAAAQSGGAFEIKSSVVAAGGNRSAGGSFTLEATAGEAVAGTESTGGSFALASGY